MAEAFIKLPQLLFKTSLVALIMWWSSVPPLVSIPVNIEPFDFMLDVARIHFRARGSVRPLAGKIYCLVGTRTVYHS